MSLVYEVLRTEKKYSISPCAAALLDHKLSSVFTKDQNSGEDGYTVKSLYFDTIYDSDFMDKLDGVENRRKIRLRTYGTNSDFVKLEIKEKFDQLQRKSSILLTNEQAKEIITGNYSCLLGVGNSVAQKLYCLMQQELYLPKCIVEYKRKAYILPENNTRITIDSQIMATEASTDLFCSNGLLTPVDSSVILEIKYNHFLLDSVKTILNLADQPQVSYSKYTMARQSYSL